MLAMESIDDDNSLLDDQISNNFHIEENIQEEVKENTIHTPNLQQ